MSSITSFTNIPVLTSRKISVGTYLSGGATLKQDLNINVSAVDIRSANSIAFVLECRTTDPVSPEIGRIWFRTDI